MLSGINGLLFNLSRERVRVRVRGRIVARTCVRDGVEGREESVSVLEVFGDGGKRETVNVGGKRGGLRDCLHPFRINMVCLLLGRLNLHTGDNVECATCSLYIEVRFAGQ